MKHLFFIVTFLSFSFYSYSQNGTQLIEAFSKSYQMEAQSNFDAAIKALQTYYSEKSYELNLRLGWLQYLKGDFFQSEKYYQKATQLMPYSVEAKLGYALPVKAMGNWTKAISTYEDVLKIDPKNTLAHYHLGAIYYELKNYEKAYKHTEVVVNLYPFDHDSVVLFAWIHLQIGQSGKAKVLFQKALMIIPGSESAKAGLAMLQ
jgi:tetratricopeptide (TPR) repeat protein